MFSLASAIFAVGNFTLVDNENRAHMIEKRGEASSLWFAVKCFIGNRFERNVFQTRCELINIMHEASARSGITRIVTPPPPSMPLQTTVQNPNSIRLSLFVALKDTLKSCRNWSVTSRETHLSFKHLKQNISNSKGHMRLFLPKSTCNE